MHRAYAATQDGARTSSAADLSGNACGDVFHLCDEGQLTEIGVCHRLSRLVDMSEVLNVLVRLIAAGAVLLVVGSIVLLVLGDPRGALVALIGAALAGLGAFELRRQTRRYAKPPS